MPAAGEVAARFAGAAVSPPSPGEIAAVGGGVARRSSEPAQAHFGLVVKPIPKPLNTALRGVEPMQIIRAARPQVGRDVSLWMFRAAYFMGLVQPLGKEFLPWGLMAGRKFGRLMEIETYEQMGMAFEKLRIGVLGVHQQGDDVMFEVSDSMICAGLLGIEEPCCAFVGGLIGTVVNRVTGRDATIREVRCMGMGHESCQFEVEFSRSVSMSDLTASPR